MEINEVEEVLNIFIPKGNYETLNGFLFHHLNRIPKENDEIRLYQPSYTWKFSVKKVNSKQVATLLIEKLTNNQEISQ